MEHGSAYEYARIEALVVVCVLGCAVLGGSRIRPRA